jgi:hypothetical protein
MQKTHTKQGNTGQNLFWVGDMSKIMFDATCRVIIYMQFSLARSNADCLIVPEMSVLRLVPILAFLCL